MTRRRTTAANRRVATPVETVGLSPKTALAGLLPIVAGVILLVLDKLGVAEIDDELWIGLLIGGPAAGVGAYAGKPGNVLIPTSAPKGE